MGLCTSSHITSQNGFGFINLPSSAKIIHVDGWLQELKQPTRAGEILSQNPSCFLCSSETMNINSLPTQVPKDDLLQLGQLYFLMPISKCQTLLTLQDLCTLAIKASTALNDLDMRQSPSVERSPFSDGNCVVNFLDWTEGSFRVPNSCNGIVGVDSHMAAGNQSLAFYDHKLKPQ